MAFGFPCSGRHEYRHDTRAIYWGKSNLLGDTVVATAILDRLLHHSHVLNIRGSSYRLREKQQAGLQAGLTTAHQWMKPSSEESQASK